MSEDGLEALYDRFLLKFMVKPIQEETNFKKMITSMQKTPETIISLDEINIARKGVQSIEVNEGMADLLIKLRRNLQHQGIYATDRTYNTAMKILKAEAYLKGRNELIEDDFDILRHILWSDPKDERIVWSTILEQISPEKGKIISLYEDALEIANQTLQEKDSKKRLERGVDTATKLKTVKTKIEKYIDEMEKKKKDVSEARQYNSKVNDLLAKVFSEACNLNINT